MLDEVEEGWWKGRLDGKEGVFPCNFVEEIEDEAPWPETKPTTTTSMTQPKTQKPQGTRMQCSHSTCIYTRCSVCLVHALYIVVGESSRLLTQSSTIALFPMN